MTGERVKEVRDTSLRREACQMWRAFFSLLSRLIAFTLRKMRQKEAKLLKLALLNCETDEEVSILSRRCRSGYRTSEKSRTVVERGFEPLILISSQIQVARGEAADL